MSDSRWLRSAGPATAIALRAALSVGLTAACGGTEHDERPGAEPDRELEPLLDPGSAAPNCGADDAYEIWLLEDWETGAGNGWYSNNEYCQPCTDLQNEIDEVGRPAKCLAQLDDVQSGCDPSAVGDAAAAAYRDLERSVRHYLPKEDPEVEELTALVDQFDDCDVVSEAECDGGELFQRLLPLVRKALRRAQRLQAEFDACRADCDATQTPAALTKPFPGEEIPGGRCGSSRGVHVQLKRWIHREGTLGRQFSPTDPLDASDYEGVSFWMRNVPGSRSTFRVSVPDAFTDEKSVVDGEPVCTFINPKELTDNACDKFGRYFLTTSDWQFFAIPFAEMRQNGFGKQAPFFDMANLMGLAFEYKQGRWDYWIDDIGFYRKK